MIRIATDDDVVTLCELERAASTAGLRHVFGDLPFPEDDVLARWRIVLDDPAATVLLDAEDGVAIGYAAVADNWLQHFGVTPSWWGTGRAQALYAAAADILGRSEASEWSLWVLVANHRARAFYERLGWRDTEDRESEVFEPYPVKTRMTRPAIAPRSRSRP